MLYIHNLQSLNPKSAEVEVLPLIRELKKKTPYPLAEDKFLEQFSSLFVSTLDKENMEQALQIVAPTIEKVKKLMLEKDSVHEHINLQRTIQLLNEVPVSLQKNLEFAQEIIGFQVNFAAQLTGLLNRIPQLKVMEEKKEVNRQLDQVFQKILRNSSFTFNYKDIINEAHIEHMRGLVDSMEKGYFFSVSLEEELKKMRFEELKLRIPQQRLQEAEDIKKDIDTIKKGVDRAYELNMRMLNWAVILYSYIKWLSTSK
jgi:D-Tyr-tRNAtyr deacylase